MLLQCAKKINFFLFDPNICHCFASFSETKFSMLTKLWSCCNSEIALNQYENGSEVIAAINATPPENQFFWTKADHGVLLRCGVVQTTKTIIICLLTKEDNSALVEMEGEPEKKQESFNNKTPLLLQQYTVYGELQFDVASEFIDYLKKNVIHKTFETKKYNENMRVRYAGEVTKLQYSIKIKGYDKAQTAHTLNSTIESYLNN